MTKKQPLETAAVREELPGGCPGNPKRAIMKLSDTSGFQCLLQSGGAGGMDMQHRNAVFLGLLGGADHHLVRNRAGKQNHQVWRTDLLLHGTVFLGKHLCLIAVLLAYLLVAANHTFVSADNYNAHNGYPFCS